MSDHKNIAPAFRKTWSVQPLSYLYNLVLWGVPVPRTVQILQDLLPGRTEASITSLMWKVRAYLTAKQDKVSNPKWVYKGLSERIEQAAKLPVHSNIARFKEEGKGFQPVILHRNPKGSKPKVSFSSILPPEPESPFVKQKLVRPMAEAEQPIAPEPTPHKMQIPDWVEEHNRKLKSFDAAQQKKLAEDPPNWVKDVINAPMSAQTDLSVIEEIKQMVTFARTLGATEVEYKGVKLKF